LFLFYEHYTSNHVAYLAEIIRNGKKIDFADPEKAQRM